LKFLKEVALQSFERKKS